MAIDPTLNVSEVAYPAADPVLIPVPTSTATGDLLIAMVYTDDAEVTVSPPTALGTWTNIADIDSPIKSMDLRVWWKIAAGEVTNMSFDLSGAAAAEGKCYRITGHDATTPIDATTVTDNDEAGTTKSFPSITTATDGALLIGIGCSYSGGAWAPSGSPALTERDDAVGQIWVGSALLATAGASGARTCGGPNSDGMTVMVAIRPAVAASGIPPGLGPVVGMGHRMSDGALARW